MTQHLHDESHRDRLKREQATRREHAARGVDRLSRPAQPKPKPSQTPASPPPAAKPATKPAAPPAKPVTPRPAQSPTHAEGANLPPIRPQPRSRPSTATPPPAAAQSAQRPIHPPRPDEMIRPAAPRRPKPAPSSALLDLGISPLMQALFGVVLLAIVVTIIAAILASNWGSFRAFISGRSGIVGLEAQATARAIANAPAPTPIATVAPVNSNAANAKRIGIVSGHRGNDSGSVCADGYTEAELVYQVSVATAAQLRARGYTVDILDEFDARLDGYTGIAFLSIHADSCTYYNELLTGFKVARSELSAVPAVEDKLVACLRDRYGKATGLKWNSNTITHDMTNYHAFRKIAPQTPAAIIELGFLNLDRETLQKRTNKVIEGVLDGMLCFVQP